MYIGVENAFAVRVMIKAFVILSVDIRRRRRRRERIDRISS